MTTMPLPDASPNTSSLQPCIGDHHHSEEDDHDDCDGDHDHDHYHDDDDKQQ